MFDDDQDCAIHEDLNTAVLQKLTDHLKDNKRFSQVANGHLQSFMRGWLLSNLRPLVREEFAIEEGATSERT